MWELLRILFLGKVVALTPAGVTLTSDLQEFSAREPLEVITEGANLRLDVSSLLRAHGAAEAFEISDKLFPSGCIKAEGVLTNGDSHYFSLQTTSYAPESVELILQSPTVRVGMRFKLFRLSSCRRVERSSLTWRNLNL